MEEEKKMSVESKSERISKNMDNVDFEILWMGQPSGLWGRFLSSIRMNFTTYKISKDELIIQKGFFRRKTDSIELYLLKDPDLVESLYQRLLGIGTIRVRVDDKGPRARFGDTIYLKNIQQAPEVRKLLRDAIEEDIMERKITYFDKI